MAWQEPIKIGTVEIAGWGVDVWEKPGESLNIELDCCFEEVRPLTVIQGTLEGCLEAKQPAAPAPNLEAALVRNLRNLSWQEAYAGADEIRKLLTQR